MKPSITGRTICKTLLILITLTVFMVVIEFGTDYTFCVLALRQSQIALICLILISIITFLWILQISKKRDPEEDQGKSLLIAVGVVVLLCIIALLVFALAITGSNYYFVSPDSTRHVLITEYNNLLGGDIYVYKSAFPLIYQRISSCSFNHPIRHEAYELKWGDSYIDIIYDGWSYKSERIYLNSD